MTTTLLRALPVLLPDHPLRRAFLFLFRAATSHALAGASAFLFFLFCAATSHALAAASSPEVNDGCFGLHCGLLPD
jgi:hypothetical protein